PPALRGRPAQAQAARGTGGLPAPAAPGGVVMSIPNMKPLTWRQAQRVLLDNCKQLFGAGTPWILEAEAKLAALPPTDLPDYQSTLESLESLDRKFAEAEKRAGLPPWTEARNLAEADELLAESHAARTALSMEVESLRRLVAEWGPLVTLAVDVTQYPLVRVPHARWVRLKERCATL